MGEDHSELGQQIKKYRELAGYSQMQLAKKLGVTQGAISQWENGRVSPKNFDRVQKIGDALRISTSRLLGEEETISEEKPSEPRQVTDAELKFALFGGDSEEITDAQFEEVKRFARFIKERDAK